ncbi:MAG: hypothetical protein PVJ28_00220 [Acidimicrobiia bacterium]|jgi:hypothetical protein
MAVTASGLYVATFVDAFDATQLAVDLSLATHKLALFSNSITPNFTTDTAYGASPYDANEVSGTNWPSGGVALSAAASGGGSTSPTLTASSGTMVYDMADVSVATVTVSAARAALLYADALAGDNAICLIDFGGDYSPTAGTLSITWDAAGVFVIDLTP